MLTDSLSKTTTGVKLIPYAYYLLFLVLFWVIHLVCISAVSSIHFSLGHDLQITEDWIYNKAWVIISIANIAAFLIVCKIIALEHFIEPIQDLFQRKEWGHYKKRSIVYVLYCYFAILFLGGAIGFNSNSFQLLPFLINFVGMTILITLNYFLLFFIVREFFKGLLIQRITFLVLSLIFYIIFFESTALYKIYQINIYYLFMLPLLGLLIGERYQWNIGVYLIVLFVLPITTLMGFDPIYGKEFSPFIFVNNINLMSLGLTFLIGTSYLYGDRFKRK